VTAGRWTSIGLPVLVAACVLAACASTPGAVPSGSGAAHAPATIPSGSRSPAAPSPAPSPSPSPSDLPSPSPPAAAPTRRTPSAPSQPPPPPHSAAPALPAAGAGGPGTFGPTGSGVLNGKIIAIDPGHNGGNYSDPSYINHLIFNGREQEACDTTGTETDSGYTESEFNWNVAQALSAALRAAGATVVLTRTSNSGVGPCVTDRAAIGNNAHANAAVSIHADGGPPGGRGFAILEPVADGPNDAIIGPSQTLGTDLRNAFAAGTGEPVSSYDGVDGIQARDDLGGTNLSTVPKVFVECANMRNAADAALVTSSAWQSTAAQAIATGLTAFLTG